MSHDPKNNNTVLLMEKNVKSLNALNNMNSYMMTPDIKTNEKLAKTKQLEFNDIVNDLLHNMHKLNVQIVKDHALIMPPVQSANSIDYSI